MQFFDKIYVPGSLSLPNVGKNPQSDATVENLEEFVGYD